MGRSFAFGLGFKPKFSFKGVHLDRVLTKPKAEKGTEVTGQGLHLDPEAGFEFSLGFGSTSGLQRLEVTTINMGGGLSAPTNSELSKGAEEFSFPPEGTSSCLNTSLAADLFVFEGFTNQVVAAAHSLLLSAGSRLVSFALESSMHASYPTSLCVCSASRRSECLGAWIWILRVFLRGSSPALEFSGIGSDFGVSSLGAAASGERLLFSFPVMSECGEEGDSPYPLSVYPPNMPLDWVSDGAKNEDPSFAILDANEEDFHRVN
jgi:hypothetical protein